MKIPFEQLQHLKQLQHIADDIRARLKATELTMERTKGHKPDVSTTQNMIENERAIATHLIRRLESIEYALQRAKSGLYGVCIRCEEPIPTKRLRAIPEACVCISCLSE